MTQEVEVKVEETPKREIKKLTARDVRTIIKFLAKTEIKDELFELFKPQDLTPVFDIQASSWGEYRVALDLTKEELAEHQQTYITLEKACIYNDLGTVTTPKPRTQEQVTYKLVEIVYSLLDSDERYELTIELIANLYKMTTDEVEEMDVKELSEMVVGVVGGTDFFS